MRATSLFLVLMGLSTIPAAATAQQHHATRRAREFVRLINQSTSAQANAYVDTAFSKGLRELADGGAWIAQLRRESGGMKWLGVQSMTANEVIVAVERANNKRRNSIYFRVERAAPFGFEGIQLRPLDATLPIQSDTTQASVQLNR